MDAVINRHRASKSTKDLLAELDSLASSGPEDDSEDAAQRERQVGLDRRW